MRLIEIYKCLCDETRLRILHLLTVSPLCVCHIQQTVGKPQVKISQHLAYLKERRMVEVERHHQWMIYSLPAKKSPELEANLKCLQDCVRSDAVFAKDKAKLLKLMNSKSVTTLLAEGCCNKPSQVKYSCK